MCWFLLRKKTTYTTTKPTNSCKILKVEAKVGQAFSKKGTSICSLQDSLAVHDCLLSGYAVQALSGSLCPCLAVRWALFSLPCLALSRHCHAPAFSPPPCLALSPAWPRFSLTVTVTVTLAESNADLGLGAVSPPDLSKSVF